MRRIIFISIVFQICSVFSQDTSILKYFPLQVGNVWVYFNYASGPGVGGIGYNRVRITGTSLVSGHLYYLFEHTHFQVLGTLTCPFPVFNDPLRVDSTSGNVMKSVICQPEGTYLIDSLRSNFNDRHVVCGGFQGDTSVCVDTTDFTIFGSSKKSKKFIINAFEGYNSTRFVISLGVAKYQYHQLMEDDYVNLIGCYVNGVMYGDTGVPLGINQISTEIPDQFSLFQNYPNPFNPKTVIKFDIPPSKGDRGMTIVKLVIYDALGKEVTTLVKKQLSPGTYQADWDATSFPSGVYFYQLTANDEFIAAKKMVLIK